MADHAWSATRISGAARSLRSDSAILPALSVRFTCLARRGSLLRRQLLVDPYRRQALIGELTAAVRLQQEVNRLRQENRQLSSILHFSGDGIVTIDPALRITGFNPAMEIMTAWRQHEVVGRFYHDVLLPRDIQGVPLSYDHDPVVLAIETGKAVTDQQLILLARDGQSVDVSVTAAAVRAAGGSR